MKYQFRAGELLKKKQPSQIGLEFTSVQRFELGMPVKIQSGPEEICFVVIRGVSGFDTGSVKDQASFRDMIYLPRNSNIQLYAVEPGSVVMAYGAPAHRDTKFAYIHFEEIDQNTHNHKEYGDALINCRRDVWHYINDDFNACRLMMGLCRGDTGGWTSWPPHEHSEEKEEIYTYFNMGDAFGIQCVYEDMANPIIIALVREGDIISIPRGYHPNTGSPAGAISFVYCMVSKKPDDRKFMDLRIQKIYGDTFK